MKKMLLFLGVGCIGLMKGYSQDVQKIMQSMQEKYSRVKDYTATATLETHIPFIKAPAADVMVYYQQPDKLSIKNKTGISFIPKGSGQITLANIFSMEKYTALDAGAGSVGGKAVRLIRVIPEDAMGDLVLATLYVDISRMLVLKAITTTRDDGSYTLEFNYGKYSREGLPDRVVFSFNLRDYKLPKGVTLDYDNGTRPAENHSGDSGTGSIILVYHQYIINAGLSPSVFSSQ